MLLQLEQKALTYKQVLYRHIFRNALLVVVAGFPQLLFIFYLHHPSYRGIVFFGWSRVAWF